MEGRDGKRKECKEGGSGWGETVGKGEEWLDLRVCPVASKFLVTPLLRRRCAMHDTECCLRLGLLIIDLTKHVPTVRSLLRCTAAMYCSYFHAYIVHDYAIIYLFIYLLVHGKQTIVSRPEMALTGTHYHHSTVKTICIKITIWIKSMLYTWYKVS